MPGVADFNGDQWPETSAGFSLSLDANSVCVTLSGSDSVHIKVDAASTFSQNVQLSCVGGVPKGFSCSFSPETLDGGGSSTITIRPVAGTMGSASSGILLTGMVFGLFAFVFLTVGDLWPEFFNCLH